MKLLPFLPWVFYTLCQSFLIFTPNPVHSPTVFPKYLAPTFSVFPFFASSPCPLLGRLEWSPVLLWLVSDTVGKP